MISQILQIFGSDNMIIFCTFLKSCFFYIEITGSALKNASRIPPAILRVVNRMESTNIASNLGKGTIILG